MKIFYKTLVLGVFLAVLAVVSPTFAQDVCADIEANQALYKQYTDNYKGTLEQKKTAVKAGNEYIQKYAACEAFAQQIDYLKKVVPKKEEEIKTEESAKGKTALYERFDKAAKAGNTAEIYASGEEILKTEPEFLDVILVLASVGLDEAAEKQNDTYNGKALDYAKSAIKKIEGGTKSEKFGAYKYEYKTKENALGWMNYTVGYIEYYRQKKTDSGLSYFYKATQLGQETKERDFIYALIGEKYVAQAEVLNKEIIELIKVNKGQENFESKSKLALSKGYADRAIEAYAKAYEVAKANMNKEKDAAKKTKMNEYVNNLFATLKSLYKFRYETIEKPINDTDLVQQLNSHIASVTSKPLTNPTAEVTPVDPPSEDEKTTETTTSTTTTTTSPTTTTTSPTTAKTPAPTTPKPPTKTMTNGATVKTEADKTKTKPKQK